MLKATRRTLKAVINGELSYFDLPDKETFVNLSKTIETDQLLIVVRFSISPENKIIAYPDLKIMPEQFKNYASLIWDKNLDHA